MTLKCKNILSLIRILIEEDNFKTTSYEEKEMYSCFFLDPKLDGFIVDIYYDGSVNFRGGFDFGNGHYDVMTSFITKLVSFLNESEESKELEVEEIEPLDAIYGYVQS